MNWSRSTAGVLALLIYLLPLVLFFKNRKTLFFVYTALIGAQVFFFVTQRAAIRFHGMTFILIILGLWIENYYTSEEFKLKRFLNVLQLPLFRKPIIYGILLLQFSSGIYAYSMDIIYPFSSAKETVTYIKNNNYDTAEIITVTCDGTLLSAYLQEKIYFLCNQNLQSFCHWDCSCSANITQKKNIEMLTSYMDSQSRNKVLFVSYYSLSNNNKTKDWITLNEKIKVRLVKEFNQNIVEKTNYYLFEVSKIKK